MTGVSSSCVPLKCYLDFLLFFFFLNSSACIYTYFLSLSRKVLFRVESFFSRLLLLVSPVRRLVPLKRNAFFFLVLYINSSGRHRSHTNRINKQQGSFPRAILSLSFLFSFSFFFQLGLFETAFNTLDGHLGKFEDLVCCCERKTQSPSNENDGDWWL